jgi:ADP-ribose pyrophosphatase YjhB (NUDIX family)
MHVDEHILAAVRARYGEPHTLEFEAEISSRELDVVTTSTRRNRFHDVTFFVFSNDRLALIQKPHYTEGLWRPPGGGLRPGEPFEAGVEREALEELGVDIALSRYLVAASAVFRHGGIAIPWTTHVLAATTAAAELAPIDTHEISAARWGTLDELQRPIRERLLATGTAFWRYRVALHDAAASVLTASTN